MENKSTKKIFYRNVIFIFILTLALLITGIVLIAQKGFIFIVLGIICMATSVFLIWKKLLHKMGSLLLLETLEKRRKFLLNNKDYFNFEIQDKENFLKRIEENFLEAKFKEYKKVEENDIAIIELQGKLFIRKDHKRLDATCLHMFYDVVEVENIKNYLKNIYEYLRMTNFITKTGHNGVIIVAIIKDGEVDESMKKIFKEDDFFEDFPILKMLINLKENTFITNSEKTYGFLTKGICRNLIFKNILETDKKIEEISSVKVCNEKDIEDIEMFINGIYENKEEVYEVDDDYKKIYDEMENGEVRLDDEDKDEMILYYKNLDKLSVNDVYIDEITGKIEERFFLLMSWNYPKNTGMKKSETIEAENLIMKKLETYNIN